jgi:ABC-type glycerol-3-phosphate transport system substrate-binding protein
MLICNNGHFASPDAKKITVNSAEGLETLEWMVNFTNDINGGISNVDDFFKGRNDATVKDYPFHKGLMGVYWQNVSVFGHIKTNTPEKYADPKLWGCALRPYNGKNTKAKTQGETGLAFAWGQVIPKAVSKAQQDAAYKFIEFLSTNDKGVCSFLFAQDRPAPLISCNANPDYKKNNPYWDVVLKGLATDTSSPVTPVQAQITSLMNESIQKAFFGTLKPKAALDEAVAKTQPILDKYWSGS